MLPATPEEDRAITLDHPPSTPDTPCPTSLSRARRQQPSSRIPNVRRARTVGPGNSGRPSNGPERSHRYPTRRVGSSYSGSTPLEGTTRMQRTPPATSMVARLLQAARSFGILNDEDSFMADIPQGSISPSVLAGKPPSGSVTNTLPPRPLPTPTSAPAPPVQISCAVSALNEISKSRNIIPPGYYTHYHHIPLPSTTEPMHQVTFISFLHYLGINSSDRWYTTTLHMGLLRPMKTLPVAEQGGMYLKELVPGMGAHLAEVWVVKGPGGEGLALVWDALREEVRRKKARGEQGMVVLGVMVEGGGDHLHMSDDFKFATLSGCLPLDMSLYRPAGTAFNSEGILLPAFGPS
ncbi:hypothetical protein BDZ91DRAFT_830065 [Kalaharituber pfeilii]|nr:hypothetical protein BDZ91DRAFT_830065 [Kalaharituber pfeilii]